MTSIVNNIDDEIISKYFEGSIMYEHMNEESEDEDVEYEIMKENKNVDISEIAIGIDLGTTNSCAGVWRNNRLEIIVDDNGNRTLPSYVAYTGRNRYIGHEAKNQRDLNPKNVFYEVKRLIGMKITDESVMNELEYMTYEICGDENDNVVLRTEQGKKHTPEEISATLLRRIKDMACEYLRENIVKAVITVPAYFTDAQRQATKDAANIAGLECIRIINEPTAAALAYGLLDKTIKEKNKSMNVLIYDLGGGTIDVSILNIDNGIFEVLSSVGNTHLGGADFDNKLIKHCLSEFMKKYNYENINDLPILSVQKLRRACENAKMILSTNDITIIAVKEFYDGKDLLVNISRDNYVKLCRDLLILCMKPLDDSLRSAKLNIDDIDEVILVGGMTRMPIIKDNIKNYFNGKKPNYNMNQDEVVAAGAAIQAYILTNKRDPFSENITLLDIVPLSLGVETMGSVMDIIIPRNTVMPTSRKKLYTTDTDYCESVKIRVFEGERHMTKDNFFVGEFILTGIEPLKRGIPHIEVKFNIDVNGIITATAKNVDTKSQSVITINSNKGRLTKQEIEKIIEESRINELEDKIKKHKKMLYYDINDLCDNIKSNVVETHLSQSDKKVIEEDIQLIMSWLMEKSFEERSVSEYTSIVTKIKKKYGILILKVNNISNSVKSNVDPNLNKCSTTIYEDKNKEDEETIHELIDDSIIGLDKLDETEVATIKQLRTNLIDLCNSIYEIISSNNMNVDKEQITDMLEYIDDTMLWVHIHNHPKINDYKSKIDEINGLCNKLVESLELQNINVFQDNILGSEGSEIIELEQLCFTLKSCIDCDTFLKKDIDKINYLDKYVSETLEWLVNKPNSDLIRNRIDYINTLCNELYDESISLYSNTNIDVN